MKSACAFVRKAYQLSGFVPDWTGFVTFRLRGVDGFKAFEMMRPPTQRFRRRSQCPKQSEEHQMLMNLLRRLPASALITLMSLISIPLPNARAVTIDWVTVGNPGNAPNPSSPYGAVAYTFDIMKYEWTNSQYVAFLNAVDPQGLNPYGIFNTDVIGDPRLGITNTGTVNGSRYATKANMGDKPVNYVDWWDVAQVANWVHAGSATYGTTASGSVAIDSGAYTLNGAISGAAPAKNVGARYWIPTKNEWFKAAFYSPILNSGSGGYYIYATQSFTDPTAVAATLVGTGSASGVSPVTAGNFVNYLRTADWNSQDGNVTTVGSNGGPSYYGTFDQNGNVVEWNSVTDSSNSGVVGGSWKGQAGDIAFSYNNSTYPTSGFQDGIGFRLAAVPEPSACIMAFAGLACGGYSMWRRHKRACRNRMERRIRPSPV